MLATEASGFLVGSAVFKTVEGATSSLAGSIPVRLRDEKTREGPLLAGDPAFDVVVVGAGAAGCVVAARLAQRASRSVALIEAGPDLRTDISKGLRDGWHMVPDFDWGYASEPDEHAAAETLRRGKLVGGTSWVTRFAVRGSPADFDAWATLGNPGWSFEDVLPAFIALETDLDFGDRPWHGNAGPIPIGRYLDLEPTEIVAATLAAMEACGFPHVEDHNRPGAVGAGRMPMSSRDGARVTTADAYLTPVGAPSNLTILPDVHVAEVVLEDVRATGVRLSDGSMVRAGWVVLSAGTYGSPPILVRSGIGPPKHLRSMGLPVRIELPGVGENLADHPGVDLDLGQVGSTTDASLLHAIATFHSDTASADDPPDLMAWTSDPSGDPPAYEIDVVLLKPRSRGSVRLRSPDPMEPPRIDLPGVREPTDVDRLLEAYRRVEEVANDPSVRRLTGDRPSSIGDDVGGGAWIRANSYSIPHVVGTCAMGPSPDDGAVVDAAGRVHGAERLSVVDASIMPEAPSGFPHLVTIMMAERLSERIAAWL